MTLMWKFSSNLDTDTYNFTLYSTSQFLEDTKFLDTVVGFGKLKSDILSIVDGENLTADRMVIKFMDLLK